MGIFKYVIVIPQIVAALGGVNFLQIIFGEVSSITMLLAGLLLILAGLTHIDDYR